MSESNEVVGSPAGVVHDEVEGRICELLVGSTFIGRGHSTPCAISGRRDSGAISNNHSDVSE